MSYLLDKSKKRNKSIKILLCIAVIIFVLYFRSGIFYGFSYVGLSVFRPILNSGLSIGGKLQSLTAYFSLKDSLSRENEYLISKIDEDRENRANYDSVLAENAELKNILGRKSEELDTILATILAKPNQSAYDTLLIDIGSEDGVSVGNRVFASGNVPIGSIREVYSNSSKVVLFSNSGEVTPIVVSNGNIFLDIVGRGGGNFEMALPRDATLLKGDQVVLAGIMPYVVGVVETIISDPRDSFQKALLVAPVNIQQLKFVQIQL